MKNFIGCLLIFLLGVGATLGFLAWRERVRSRSQETTSTLDLDSAVKTRRQLGVRALKERRKDGAVHIVLSEAELRALAIAAIADHPRGAEFARVVREVKIDLEENSLEFGVSVDVSALERSGLVEAAALERVLDVVPMLRGREVYVGFRGTPGARDGRIGLADDLEITLGFVTVPIEVLAEKLGLSVAGLSSKLEFEIEGVVVEEVRAGLDEITLEARPR